MKKADSCKGCPLEYRGEGWVPPTGTGTNGVLIVGEAPGEQEARLGVPWVGAAGHFLDKTLRQAGAERAQFRLHNCLSCFPVGNKLTIPGQYEAGGVLLRCEPNLRATIEGMKPRVILAMGATALTALTGCVGIQRHRGFVLDAIYHQDGVPIPVVATYHPSHLLPGRARNDPARDRPHRYLGLVNLDVQRALTLAREGRPAPIPTYYLQDPGPVTAGFWADDVLRNPPPYLSVDIETLRKIKMHSREEEMDEDDMSAKADDPDSGILRIAFCDRPGHAMTVPWASAGPMWAVIHRLLDSPIPKLFWNGHGFDIPVLRGAGQIVSGDIHDGMWAWHVLQSDLDRKLESVTAYFGGDLKPWKHLMESMTAWYNCVDTDAALRNMLGIEAELRRSSLWDFYLRYHRQLDPVLYRAGRERGLPIDRHAQQDLGRFLTAEVTRLLQEAQGLVPDAVKAVTLYTRKPPLWPTREVLAPATVKVCSLCGQLRATSRHPCVVKLGATILTTTHQTTQYQVVFDPAALGEAPTLEQIEGLVDLAGFNPNSPPQLIRYVQLKGHKATAPSVRSLVENMDADALYWLTKRYGSTDPIYPLTSTIRDLRKTKGTYVDGFAPDHKSRIYTTLSRVPSTYRFSSRNVNLQNVSHRSDKRFADRIRGTIVPPPGHVFVSCDWSAIEAVLVGHFAEDPDYIRGAQQGIHDLVNCTQHGESFTEETRLRSKTEWKDDREKYKRVVHLSNYDGTPYEMRRRYPEIFPTLQSATELQAQYFRMFPSIPVWHDKVRSLAHHQHYLQSPWGFRHWFWRVYYHQDGVRMDGEDAKRCVAFLPQHSAAMMMSDLILDLSSTPWERFMLANLTIHDELTLCVPDSLAEECGEMLLDRMTRPVPLLDGLRVGAECKMGTLDGSWATVTPWREVRILTP